MRKKFKARLTHGDGQDVGDFDVDTNGTVFILCKKLGRDGVFGQWVQPEVLEALDFEIELIEINEVENVKPT